MAGLESILDQAGVASDGGVDRAAVDLLLRRLDAGRPDSLAAVESAGRWLGVGLAGVLNVLDVPTVVLGGGYARLGRWLAEPVTTELTERVIGGGWRPVRVLASALGPDAAVRGAAISVVRAILADPARFIAEVR
jgi:predicted NBD/HSP70 family sugar kinase